MASSPKFDSYFLPLSVLIGSIIIASAVFYAGPKGDYGAGPVGGQLPSAPVGGAKPAVAVDVKQVKTSGNPFVGSASAPITIAYWFDYQCPFCKQYEQNVMSTLVTDYVNTGKAKIVFKDYAFLGADSQTLSLAARAVWQVAPSKFYAWHKNMFQNQGQENSGWATTEKIRQLTQSVLGAADTDKVIALMKSKATEFGAAISADRQEGTALGVTGTPSTIIGKQLLIGARPYVDFKTAIDSLK